MDININKEGNDTLNILTFLNYLSGYKSFMKLKGSRHITFNDYTIFSRQKMESKALSSIKDHEVINATTIRFLNEFLCGKKGDYSNHIENNEYTTLIDEYGNEI